MRGHARFDFKNSHSSSGAREGVWVEDDGLESNIDYDERLDDNEAKTGACRHEHRGESDLANPLP